MSFTYDNGRLWCEGVSLEDIAAQFGTPTYVYSMAEIERRIAEFRPFAADGHLIAYAVKANGNPAILRLMDAAAFGADVTSGGELFLALHAGIPAERILFSGVGKREDEIALAIDAGIRALHVESDGELALIARIAAEKERVTAIAVRVNPDIGADTHRYDSTGLREHKFGVPPEMAFDLFRRAEADPWLNPVGLAAHIGSQITSLQPYRALVAFLVDLAGELAAEGITLTTLDAGGGLGIAYQDESLPSIGEWMTALSREVHAAGYQLIVEPGRALVGAAGVLLTRVLYNKHQGDKRFLIVDAGFNDLIRPALYQAYHDIRPVREPQESETVHDFDVVGPVCETGDFLAHGRAFALSARSGLLAVMDAGAYGFAMSSNYNGRLRLAEVLVDGGDCTLIRRRQTYAHLLDGTTA